METSEDIDTTKRSDDSRESYMKKRVIVPSLTAIILIVIGVYFVVHSIFYQSTDDAFVEGPIVTIAPQVAGPVTQMLVLDNKPVKKGDLLIVIDPSNYEAALAKTKAELAQTIASLEVAKQDITKSKSNVEETKNDLVSYKSKLDFAQKDFDRYSSMYKEGIVSKQDFEEAKTDLTVAESDYNIAKEKQTSASANYESSKAQLLAMEAEIKALEAKVKTDELNLSYTNIYAPLDGLITNRSVEKGNYIQTAQPMFSIVPDEVWIVANFKETQLTNIKAGQEVNIKVDTYPRKRFKGKVDSIQRATGAKASLFPPENAVGSYVKIVQRIPVKIVFDDDISEYNIIPGMSVVPEIKVR